MVLPVKCTDILQVVVIPSGPMGAGGDEKFEQLMHCFPSLYERPFCQ